MTKDIGTQKEQWMKIDNLDKIQRADHDTLIRVEAKVDQIVTDIKDLKDGVNAKVSDHEQRINVLERIKDEVNLSETMKSIKDSAQWIHDFKVTWKVILAVAGGVGGFVGFLINLLVRLFERT